MAQTEITNYLCHDGIHLIVFFFNYYLPVSISFTKRRHKEQHITLHLNVNSIILIRAGAGIEKYSCNL